MVKIDESKHVERKLRKVGNSVAVTIPANVLREMGLKEGDTIEFNTRDNALVLKKKNPIVSDDFMSLVQKVSDKNDAAMRALVER